jgi:uncharacterized membrane protein YiaA
MTITSSKHRRFYLAMAWAGALIAAVGFSRRYFWPLAAGTFHAPSIVHLHGIITFTWVAFVIVQATLVASNRTAMHRSLGMAGIALGTLLVFTASEVAVLLLARELKEGGPSPREFVATLLSLPLLVTGLLGFGIANVARAEIHKRLMMLASFVVLTPALARIIQLIAPSMSRLARNDLAGLASDALILIAITYDMKTRGKPHPAYLVGGACVVLVQIATLLVRSTTAWFDFTDWLASLVG